MRLNIPKHYRNFKSKGETNMNLIELVSKYQSEILDNNILIEYGLFFSQATENRCKFVIDEDEELEALKSVILRLIAKDKNAEIYVNTYSMDFTEVNTHIYADSLWIDTTLEVEEIYSFFKDSRKVEPTDIVLVEDDETIDGTVALVVSAGGQVENYGSFIEKRKLCNIKSLYWD